MYKSYKLIIFTVNTNGGESETVEHLYKESKDEEGKTILVPMAEDEAIFNMLKKVSTTGGNPSVRAIKALLYNPEGNLIRTEEVIKPQAE